MKRKQGNTTNLVILEDELLIMVGKSVIGAGSVTAFTPLRLPSEGDSSF